MKNEQLQKQLNYIGGCVLIAFPVVLTIEDLYSTEVSPLKFLAGLFAVWLFAVSIFELARLVWSYHPRVSIVAGAIGLAGTFGSVSIMAFRFVIGTIKQAEGAIGNPEQFNSAVGKISPFIFLPGLIPPMILIILAAILLKHRKEARWAWALVCVGALLFPAGRIFFGQPVVLLSDALLLVSLGYMGWQMLSGNRNEQLLLETNAA
ncbi:hypothetical protein BH10ACI3_BH10ACI3_20660 [soil metagenome]